MDSPRSSRIRTWKEENIKYQEKNIKYIEKLSEEDEKTKEQLKLFLIITQCIQVIQLSPEKLYPFFPPTSSLELNIPEMAEE